MAKTTREHGFSAEAVVLGCLGDVPTIAQSYCQVVGELRRTHVGVEWAKACHVELSAWSLLAFRLKRLMTSIICIAEAGRSDARAKN